MVKHYVEQIRIEFDCESEDLPAAVAQVGRLQLVGADIQLGNLQQQSQMDNSQYLLPRSERRQINGPVQH